MIVVYGMLLFVVVVALLKLLPWILLGVVYAVRFVYVELLVLRCQYAEVLGDGSINLEYLSDDPDFRNRLEDKGIHIRYYSGAIDSFYQVWRL